MGVGVGQLTVLVLGLGGTWVGQPTSSLSSLAPGQALPSAVAGEEQSQVCAAIAAQTCVVTGAMGINTDYSCGCTMDLGMAFGGSPLLDVT